MSQSELSSSDDDFEDGNNQKVELKDNIDLVDEDKFKNMVGEDFVEVQGNRETSRMSFSL